MTFFFLNLMILKSFLTLTYKPSATHTLLLICVHLVGTHLVTWNVFRTTSPVRLRSFATGRWRQLFPSRCPRRGNPWRWRHHPGVVLRSSTTTTCITIITITTRAPRSGSRWRRSRRCTWRAGCRNSCTARVRRRAGCGRLRPCTGVQRGTAAPGLCTLHICTTPPPQQQQQQPASKKNHGISDMTSPVCVCILCIIFQSKMANVLSVFDVVLWKLKTTFYTMHFCNFLLFIIALQSLLINNMLATFLKK